MKMNLGEIMECLQAIDIIRTTVTIAKFERKGKRGLANLRKFESLSDEQKIEYIHAASVLLFEMSDILRFIKDREIEIQ